MTHWKFIAGLLLVAGALYLTARMTRYEISHGGSDRYYVVVKLDRWTGQTWKLESGGVWSSLSTR